MYKYTTLRGARLVIPTTFEECLSYGQKQDYMWKVIKSLIEENEYLREKVESNKYEINGLWQANTATGEAAQALFDSLDERVKRLEENA